MLEIIHFIPYQDSLATEDKQLDVLRTISVTTNKHRCDRHAMAPLQPHPTSG